jgi:hypothetical protein
MAPRLTRTIAALAAVLGWVSLDLQLVAAHLNAAARGIPFATATVNYFSYFTILSNILAAGVLSAFALAGRDAVGRFLRRPATATAAMLYMAVTGLIYVTILRTIWEPQGLDLLADTLLHYVMPAVYVLFWLAFAPKGGLTYRHVVLWLIFPVLYGAYSLVRGAATGFYPYPFVDVAGLGYPAVLHNMALLVGGFALFGTAVVGLVRAAQNLRAGS